MFKHLLSLRAAYLPGWCIQTVDVLSFSKLIPKDWKIHKKMVQLILELLWQSRSWSVCELTQLCVNHSPSPFIFWHTVGQINGWKLSNHCHCYNTAVHSTNYVTSVADADSVAPGQGSRRWPKRIRCTHDANLVIGTVSSIDWSCVKALSAEVYNEDKIEKISCQYVACSCHWNRSSVLLICVENERLPAAWSLTSVNTDLQWNRIEDIS